jgi:hypothetical protein
LDEEEKRGLTLPPHMQEIALVSAPGPFGLPAPILSRVTSCRARRLPVVGLLVALALAACGGGDRKRATPTGQVREAAYAYLRALQQARWTRGCGMMTASARRDIEDAAGVSCARALAGGAALPADQLAAAGREVAGAPVRVRGKAATIGPLGGLPQPLRLERVAGRWLIAG